jgi:hypothetical protein
MIWSFYTTKNSVVLQASIDQDGIQADAMQELAPGDVFYGISFKQFVAKGSGSITLDESGSAIFNS